MQIDAVEYVDLNNDRKIDEILDYGKLMCSTYYSIWIDPVELRRALIFDGKVTKCLARSLKLIYPFDYPIYFNRSLEFLWLTIIRSLRYVNSLV